MIAVTSRGREVGGGVRRTDPGTGKKGDGEDNRNQAQSEKQSMGKHINWAMEDK